MSATSSELQLQRQLRDVDQAIQHLKAKQEEAIAVTSLELPPRRDFYKIDTDLKRVPCPVCFEDILENNLRNHMLSSCGGNEVSCPAVGCRERVPASQLQMHIEHKCQVTKRRKWLAKQAKAREAEKRLQEAKRQEEALMKRKAVELERRQVRRRRWPPPAEIDELAQSLAFDGQSVESTDFESAEGVEPVDTLCSNPITISEPHLRCEQCGHVVILGLGSPDESGAPVGDMAGVEWQLKRKLQTHISQECPMRSVCCPNRQFGCRETVAIGKIQQHLKSQCVYEKLKDELIKKSKQRRELVLCPGCGERQPLMLLKKHEQNECGNRRVPCRNWHLGCPVQVRMNERYLHEDVTIDNSLRSCLYLGGCGARMNLEEDDIVPPWTVELWIYRPTAEESSKYYIRELIHWRLHMLKCKKAENDAYSSVDKSKAHMQNMNEMMAKSQSIDEKDAAFVLVQEAALALADSSFSVEDAVVSCEIAVERVKVLATAALGALNCVFNKGNLEPPVDQTVPVSLKDNMTRPPPKKTIDKKDMIAAWKASKGMNGSLHANDPVESAGDQDEVVGDRSLRLSVQDIQATESNSGHPDVDTSPRHLLASNDATQQHIEENALEEDGQASEVEPEESEDDLLSLCLTWPDWKWKVENILEELELHKSEMEIWREKYEVDWKPLVPKSSADTLSESPTGDGDQEDDGSINTNLSKKEKKALAKKRKAEAKQRREEKKLRDSLRYSAEEDENSVASQEPARQHVRDRIFEGLRRTQCLDNILSSPHGNISLNVGGSGLVGIFNALQPLMTEKEKKKSKMKKSDFRDGLHVFDMQVDRKKWTHVAVVCAKVPKDTVVLYLDGTPMETLPLAAFNLPMKWIGNDTFSFHGCILDLRIWAKPKSTREIKASMHDIIQFEEDETPITSAAGSASASSESLLSRPPSRGEGVRPSKIAANGLVAWWPFEDGLGLQEFEIGPRVVSDVTAYRFKTPLAANKRSVLRWVPAMNVPEMVLAVPTNDDSAEDVVDEKNGKSKVKKINRDELPCPSYRERNVCSYEIRRFHLAKRGRALMSLFPCPLECGDYVKKMDLKFHQRYICRNRRIQCRFTDFCQMSYSAYSQEQHEKYECQRLDARNAFLEASDMKNALELCEMCAEPVRVRDLDEHNKQHCPFRKVPCLYADCHDPVFANQLKYHLKFDCRSKELKRTTMLVSRARKRLNYPRPWGFELTFSEVDNEVDENNEGAEVLKIVSSFDRVAVETENTNATVDHSIVHEIIS